MRHKNLHNSFALARKNELNMERMMEVDKYGLSVLNSFGFVILSI